MSQYKYLIIFILLFSISLASPNQIINKNIKNSDAITIPKLINYQGKLTNLAGIPVNDSTYSITFRMYNSASGGTAFWSETQNVTTNQGIFNVLLGTNTAIESIPLSGNCYLEMQINPNPAMTPRIRLVSSAYAYLSKKSDTANYALNTNITYVDSTRISANSHKLQGKDTIALSNKYVDEGQINAITNTMIVDNTITSVKIQDGTIQLSDLAFTPATRPLTPGVSNAELQDNAVTSSKIQDGTILRQDVISTFKAPYADTSDYVRNISINYVDSSRVSVNAHKLQGKDTTALSNKFVDEGQINSISSAMIIDNSITRNDVALNFKSPYADTADYARGVQIPYVDSTRVAVNAYNAYQLQGKDTLALDLRYVNENQTNAITNVMLVNNSITSDKIQDGTITRNDVVITFKAPFSDTADYARSTPPVGVIDSARIAVDAYNAFKLQGRDTIALSNKFVDEGQINSISSAMIIDNSITRNDVITTFKAPYADTSDYVRNINITYIDSSRVSVNAHKLQGKDTLALSNKFVDEGQTNSISSAMIVDGTITNADISTTAGITDNKITGTGSLVQFLNADYLDGQHGSAFALVGHTHNYVDSARMSTNTYKLQGKDTLALSNKFVDEGQLNAISNSMIIDNAITTTKIQDGTIQLSDLAFTPAIRPLTPPVNNAEIQDNAITSSKIQDGTIQPIDLSFTPAIRPFSPPINGSEIAVPCTLSANIVQPNAVLNINNSSTGYALKVNSNSDAIIVDNTNGAGVVVNNSGQDGLFVGNANWCGLYIVNSNNEAIYIDSTNNSGVFINKAVENGVVVKKANNTGVYIENATNGLTVSKVENNGIYIDSCNLSGLDINQAENGVSINNTNSDAIAIQQAGYSGIWVNEANWNGFEVSHANLDGLYVNSAEGNGVFVNNVEGNGLYVGYANNDGVYVDSAGERGGYFANYNNDNYALEVVNNSGTGSDIKGIYVQGHGFATGGWVTSIQDNICFATINPNQEIMISGNSNLENGIALISLPDKIQKILSEEIPIKVIITPNSDCNGLYVTNKSTAGFIVKELANGRANANFDWLLIGRLKNREQTPNISRIAKKQETRNLRINRKNLLTK